jgi:CHAT domain
MEYLDFELEIGEPAEGGHWVTVLRSPAGEGRQPAHLPKLDATLEGCLGVRRDASPQTPGTSISLQAFGQLLFDAVFRGPVLSLFEATLHQARSVDQGVRIKLRIRPHLASLPWEAMYDATRQQYVTLSLTTVLSRYVALPQPIKTLAVHGPTRVLAIASTPAGTTKLNVQEERLRIEKATAGLVEQGLAQFDWISDSEATLQRLQERLQERGPFHVIHFVGHGRFQADAPAGEVAFTNQDGSVRWVDGSELGLLIQDHPSLRLVVLNCCRSAQESETSMFASVAGGVVRRGMPAVVAMQHVISDGAAIAFAEQLYRATANGLPVDAAVSEGRKAMVLRANDDLDLEWCLPVLYMRSPDGHLFVPRQHSPPAERRPPNWFKAGYIATACLLSGFAVSPLACLWHDEPRFRSAYLEMYPALFLYGVFLPLVLIALYRPTGLSLGWILNEHERQRRSLALLLGATFLVIFPGYAVISERYKQWVAPWEVVRDDSFAEFDKGAAARDIGVWPAQFFELADPEPPQGPQREAAQRRYARFFSNDRLIGGALRMSRVGRVRFLAVGATACAIALELFNIVMFVAYSRRYPQAPISMSAVRGLAAGLCGLVLWVLMRLPTAEVDAHVFADISAFEQLLPAMIATAAALAIAATALKHVIKAEWLALLGLISGPGGLVACYFARRMLAELFADVRMLGACFVLMLLVTLFLISAQSDADYRAAATRRTAA